MQIVFEIIGAAIFLVILYIGVKAVIRRLTNIPSEEDFFDDPETPRDGEN